MIDPNITLNDAAGKDEMNATSASSTSKSKSTMNLFLNLLSPVAMIVVNIFSSSSSCSSSSSSPSCLDPPPSSVESTDPTTTTVTTATFLRQFMVMTMAKVMTITKMIQKTTSTDGQKGNHSNANADDNENAKRGQNILSNSNLDQYESESENENESGRQYEHETKNFFFFGFGSDVISSPAGIHAVTITWWIMTRLILPYCIYEATAYFICHCHYYFYRRHHFNMLHNHGCNNNRSSKSRQGTTLAKETYSSTATTTPKKKKGDALVNILFFLLSLSFLVFLCSIVMTILEISGTNFIKMVSVHHSIHKEEQHSFHQETLSSNRSSNYENNEHDDDDDNNNNHRHIDTIQHNFVQHVIMLVTLCFFVRCRTRQNLWIVNPNNINYSNENDHGNGNENIHNTAHNTIREPSTVPIGPTPAPRTTRREKTYTLVYKGYEPIRKLGRKKAITHLHVWNLPTRTVAANKSTDDPASEKTSNETDGSTRTDPATTSTTTTTKAVISKIPNHAFQGCTLLKQIMRPTLPLKASSLSLPLSSTAKTQTQRACPILHLQDVGESAFAHCASLEEVHLPLSIASIPPSEPLSSPLLPSPKSDTATLTLLSPHTTINTTTHTPTIHLRSIGNFAFANCTSLKRITLGTSTITSSYFNNTGSEGTEYDNINIIKQEPQVPIGSTRETTRTDASCSSFVSGAFSSFFIGPYAFSNCISLVTIDLRRQQLQRIESYTFYNCTALKCIHIPWQYLLHIGTSAFEGCMSLQDCLPTISDANNVNTNNLTNKRGPSSISLKLQVIEARAFYGCSQFVSIDLNTGTSATNAGASPGTEVVAPYLHWIGPMAFGQCRKLTTVRLPPNVTMICKEAFIGCSSLTYLSVPNALQHVGRHAFPHHTTTLHTQQAEIAAAGEEEGRGGSNQRRRVHQQQESHSTSDRVNEHTDCDGCCYASEFSLLSTMSQKTLFDSSSDKSKYKYNKTSNDDENGFGNGMDVDGGNHDKNMNIVDNDKRLHAEGRLNTVRRYTQQDGQGDDYCYYFHDLRDHRRRQQQQQFELPTPKPLSAKWIRFWCDVNRGGRLQIFAPGTTSSMMSSITTSSISTTAASLSTPSNVAISSSFPISLWPHVLYRIWHVMKLPKQVIFGETEANGDEDGNNFGTDDILMDVVNNDFNDNHQPRGDGGGDRRQRRLQRLVQHRNRNHTRNRHDRNHRSSKQQRDELLNDGYSNRYKIRRASVIYFLLRYGGAMQIVFSADEKHENGHAQKEAKYMNPYACIKQGKQKDQ